MNNLMQSVDERTRLAGANRLEILLFSLGFDEVTQRDEIFGINVFKIREVMNCPTVTHAPDMPEGVMGLVSLRGNMIPVVDLSHFCGIKTKKPPQVLIVTEFNRNTQGFLVDSVEQIMRMDWNDIKVPPAMLTNRMNGLVTAVTELKDGRIVMIIDVERVLAETMKTDEDPSLYEGMQKIEHSATVLFADDSAIARKQIEKTLEQMGVNYISARNGNEALEKLEAIAQRAEATHTPIYELVDVVLTDIEMPEMDGFVLTKKIKSDARYKGLPVVMHSSLSSSTNITMGRNVGADAYVGKFNPQELMKALQQFLVKPAEDNVTKLGEVATQRKT